MKTCTIKLLIIGVICSPTVVLAKPCGNGHIADWKTCHKGIGSTNTSHNNSSNSSRVHRSTTTPTNGIVRIPSTVSRTQGVQPTYGRSINQGYTIRETVLRNCAGNNCQIVNYVPTGFRITWTVTENGYINLYNSPLWVNADDVESALNIQNKTELPPLN